MKKIISTIIITLFLILPITVNAEIINLDNYEQKDLIETLESEGITPAFSDYKENKNAITIYMFRGKGCSFCRRFLEFLNSITEEYGDKFILRSFETWNDANNSELFKNIGNVTGQTSTGVPYIIIGEKVFAGYVSDWDEDIKKAIEEESSAKDKFDYFKKYNDEQKKASSGSTTPVIIAVVASSIVIIVAVYIIEDKNKKEVMKHMTKIYKKLSMELTKDNKEDSTESKSSNQKK